MTAVHRCPCCKCRPTPAPPAPSGNAWARTAVENAAVVAKERKRGAECGGAA